MKNLINNPPWFYNPFIFACDTKKKNQITKLQIINTCALMEMNQILQKEIDFGKKIQCSSNQKLLGYNSI
jgi:hypothetical protein